MLRERECGCGSLWGVTNICLPVSIYPLLWRYIADISVWDLAAPATKRLPACWVCIEGRRELMSVFGSTVRIRLTVDAVDSREYRYTQCSLAELCVTWSHFISFTDALIYRRTACALSWDINCQTNSKLDRATIIISTLGRRLSICHRFW